MVEKKNLMRKPKGIGPVKGANFEGATSQGHKVDKGSNK